MTAESPVTESIRSAVAAQTKRMTIQLARELDVPELTIIRALPDGLAVELDAAHWEQIIRDFESLGKTHVISSNGAVTLECFGQFGNFSTWGEYFNVQTATLDMHIRFAEIAAAFAITKPGHMDGVSTVSFQFYDRAGNSAFKVFLTFGGKPPTPERQAAFETIRDKYRLVTDAAAG